MERFNLDYAAIVFCQNCLSNRVDINEVRDGKAVFHCYNCGREAVVEGFAIGRCTKPAVAKALIEAAEDCLRNSDYNREEKKWVQAS